MAIDVSLITTAISENQTAALAVVLGFSIAVWAIRSIYLMFDDRQIASSDEDDFDGFGEGFEWSYMDADGTPTTGVFASCPGCGVNSIDDYSLFEDFVGGEESCPQCGAELEIDEFA